jgi:hypothetical protein
MKSKEISNILTKKYDNDHVSKWFRNSKKCEWSLKIMRLSISQDIMCKGRGKNLNEFWTFYHVWCLQIETSSMEFQRVEMYMIRFRLKVMIKFESLFKIFLLTIDNISCFMWNFGVFWRHSIILAFFYVNVGLY